MIVGRTSREDLSLFELQRLRSMLKHVIVCGIKEVSRAIISRKEHDEKTEAERRDGRPCHLLLVEGSGLQAVAGTHGVCGTQTRSTHIIEVEKTLGIEAARKTIVDEVRSHHAHAFYFGARSHVPLHSATVCAPLSTLYPRPFAQVNYVMSQHGMDIDHRHVALLADVMCFRGEVG